MFDYERVFPARVRIHTALADVGREYTKHRKKLDVATGMRDLSRRKLAASPTSAVLKARVTLWARHVGLLKQRVAEWKRKFDAKEVWAKAHLDQLAENQAAWSARGRRLRSRPVL